MEKMNSVILEHLGTADNLELRTVPVPRLEAGEVLVQVEAVSVNRVLDLDTRAGRPPFGSVVKLPHVLGADHAGLVVDRAADVRSINVGDRVAVFPVIACGQCSCCRLGASEQCSKLCLIGVHRWGAYADYVSVPATQVFRLGEGVDLRDAAAAALVGALAYRQLTLCGAGHSSWIYICGASGGLGSAVMAMARFYGLRIIVSSRDEGKREQLSLAGADIVLDSEDKGFQEAVLECTDGGVGSVINNLGVQRAWDISLGILGSGGKIVCSGAIGSTDGLAIDIRQLYLRNQEIIGVRTARTEDARVVVDMLSRGFKCITDESCNFSIYDAASAHRHLEAGKGFGRIVMQRPSSAQY